MKNQVIVAEIRDHKFKTGEKQAMLRYTTDGLTKSNLKDSLFTAEELGKQVFESNRVTFIDVPKDATIESVQAKLDQYPSARIYRILNTKPIVDNVMQQVLFNGLRGEAFDNFKATHNIVAEEWNQECANTLMTSITAAQLVVYGENNTENKPADEPVLFEGKKQYRVTYLSLEGQPDIDKREGVAKLISLELGVNPLVAETVNK